MGVHILETEVLKFNFLNIQWASSFLMAHQHKQAISAIQVEPEYIKKNMLHKWH